MSKLRFRDIAKQHGVSKASVFGSMARSEATETSDLDVLVELEKGRSLLDLIAVKQDLEERLGVHVDVVTLKGLHPRLKDRILEERVAILDKD